MENLENFDIAVRENLCVDLQSVTRFFLSRFLLSKAENPLMSPLEVKFETMNYMVDENQRYLYVKLKKIASARDYSLITYIFSSFLMNITLNISSIKVTSFDRLY